MKRFLLTYFYFFEIWIPIWIVTVIIVLLTMIYVDEILGKIIMYLIGTAFAFDTVGSISIFHGYAEDKADEKLGIKYFNWKPPNFVTSAPKAEQTQNTTKVEVYYRRPVIEDHSALHHILFYGGAGQGKSALAKVIKHEISKYYGHSVEFIKVSPSQLTSKKQLDEVMLKVVDNPYCILFIDEIHGMRRVIEESLYAALQDFEYDLTMSDEYAIDDNVRLVLQQDHGAQTIKLPPFTCIGATTLIGEINKPLRDRFPIAIEMEDYNDDDLILAMEKIGEEKEPKSFDEYVGQDNAKEIIKYHLKALRNDIDLQYDKEALRLIAHISFNTMRVAKQYKKNSTVIAKARRKNIVQTEDVKTMMRLYHINDDGLARPHLAIIKALIERWRYTPEGKSHALGSQALADIANVTKSDVEEIYTPILTKLGLLQRDGRSMKQLTPYAIEKYKNIF